MTFFRYVENSDGYWTITLKRIVVGYYFYELKPIIMVNVHGGVNKDFSYNAADWPTTTYSKEVVPINKSYEIGPVKKKQPKITIEVKNDRDNSARIRETEFEIKDKSIYDLWKNGYTPAYSDYFVDVVFSWRLKPKP